MAIRFQADADFNQIIVSAVGRRNPQIDIRTATAANLAGLKDPDVLAVAARENRVLVTHDHTTMPRHFAEFVSTTPSPELIVVSQSLPRSRSSRRSHSHLGGDTAGRVDESDYIPAHLNLDL